MSRSTDPRFRIEGGRAFLRVPMDREHIEMGWHAFRPVEKALARVRVQADVETWECGRCAKAMSATGYCWSCGPTARVSVMVPGQNPTDPGYWLHRPGKVVIDWPEHDPAPTVVNTSQRPEGAPEDPSAVLKLVRAAERAGWTTRTGYSRGLLRTRSVGVYKDVEIIGVWAAPHVDGTRWYAMYERTVGAKTGWKWGAITLWTRGRPIESGLTITQLMERLFRA